MVKPAPCKWKELVDLNFTHIHTHAHTHSTLTDWTISLTHYMEERAWRASPSNTFSGRPSVSGGGSGSGGGGGGGPSDDCLSEVNHWKYMVNLSSWLYQVCSTIRAKQSCNCYLGEVIASWQNSTLPTYHMAWNIGREVNLVDECMYERTINLNSTTDVYTRV